jgi:Uma2 family endonuclease
MATTPRLLTADDLFCLPDDGQHHELVRGELRTMSPAGSEHSRIASRIAGSWHIYLADNDLGEVFGADCGFVLSNDPDTVREPDAAFVSRERFDAVGPTDKYWPGAPDLVVEVISPNDSYGDVDAKVAEWLAAGTRLVIVVNPRWYTALLHGPGMAVRALTIEDTLDGGDVLPGWRLPMTRLFSPRTPR